MKRLISLLLSFILIFNLVIIVFAVDGVEYDVYSGEMIRVTLDRESVARGEEFTLTVYSTVDAYSSTASSALTKNFRGDFYVAEDSTYSGYVEAVSYKSLNDSFEVKYHNDYTDGWVSFDPIDKNFDIKQGDPLFSVTWLISEDSLLNEVLKVQLLFNTKEKRDDTTFDISVAGITINDGNYTVSMGTDQSAVKGEKVTVPVSVGHNNTSVTGYNAYDMTFSYDTSVLELDMAQTNTAGYRVTLGDGTVRIQRYGEAAALGEALNLNFTVKTVGTANVTLLSAKVDARANAIDFDAPAATVTDDGVTVVTSTGYTVSLPDDFTTDEDDMVVEPGGSFTFKPVSPLWVYTFSVTMGDTTTGNLTFGEDGTYTIENITDNVTVAVESKTPKTFNVTVEGEEGAVQYEPTATYLQDYTFTVTPEHGYLTTVKVYVDGVSWSIYSANVRYMDGVTELVIEGSSITGDLKIVVSKKAVTQYTATLLTSDVNRAVLEPEVITYYEGDDITFRFDPAPGSNYSDVRPKVYYGSYDPYASEVYHSFEVVRNEDGSFTAKNMPAHDVTIAINSYTNAKYVEVNTYLELDDMTLFLVKIARNPNIQHETYAYTYDGNLMYKTQNYTVEGCDGYVTSWLVAVPKGEEALTVEAAQDKIGFVYLNDIGATLESVDQSGDVNMTGKVDINDAQLVYDMYQGAYSDFNTVSVLKFLNADVNGSGTLNSDDAVAIINSMQNN